MSLRAYATHSEHGALVRREGVGEPTGTMKDHSWP